MYKKIIVACTAITIIAAFVMASAASAVVLTDKTKDGTIDTLGGGVSIFIGNAPIKLTAPGFNLECSKTEMKATLTSNSGKAFEIEVPKGNASFTGTGTSGDCTSGAGSVKVTAGKLCFASGSTDNVTVTGCSGESVKFSIEITGTGSCEYSAASMAGTFKTNVEAEISISEQPLKKTVGSIFCPSEVKVDTVPLLFTTDGTAIIPS